MSPPRTAPPAPLPPAGDRDGSPPAAPPASPQAMRWLAGLVVVGVALYGGLALAWGTRALGSATFWWLLAGGGAVLAAGLLTVRRVGTRPALIAVLAGAALFRAVLVPLAPVTSTDAYRFLWDGRVQAAGISPYRFAPVDPALESLRDPTVWPRINRPEVRTIYPPAAQATFLAVHAAGLRTTQAWKAFTAVVDVLAVWLLVRVLRGAGRDPRWALAYAWNPLPIVAFGLAGHFDSLVVVALLAATLAWQRHRTGLVGIALGVAAALKLFPLLLVAAFLRPRDGRWRWPTAVTVAAGTVAVLALSYVPYVLAGGNVLGYLATGYLREEGYASGQRFVLLDVLGVNPRAAVGLAVAAVLVVALRSTRDAPTRAAWLLAAALVLTTPYPWYAAPLVALAVAGRAGALWWWWPLGLYAAYLTFFHNVFAPDLAGRLAAPVRGVLSAAVLALLVAAVRSRRARKLIAGPPAAAAPTRPLQ